MCVKDFGLLKDDTGCSICLYLTSMLDHYVICTQVCITCLICNQMFNLLQFHLVSCFQNCSNQQLCSLDICGEICQWLKYSGQDLVSSLEKIRHKWKKYLNRLKFYRESSFSDPDLPELSVGRLRTSSIVQPSLSRIDESPTSSSSMHFSIPSDCGSNEELQTWVNLPDSEAVPKPILKPGNSGQFEMKETKDEFKGRKISFETSRKLTEPVHEPLKRKISPVFKNDFQSLTNTRPSLRKKTSTASLEYYSSNSESTEESLDIGTIRAPPPSLPIGIRLSQVGGDQHYSLIDRRVGEPGIGEVVYGDRRQLKKVAEYWSSLKHKYQDNSQWPRHLREEGVVLNDYKV